MKKLMLLLPMLVVGCAYLDFGGDDKQAFEFRTFWSEAPYIGKENPETPGYDADGNKIPPPEVLATYAFPDITAGIHASIGGNHRITPTVGVELFEAKIWKARWFSGQIFAGSNVVGFGFYKRWTSIFEVTTGPFIGYDTEDNDTVWGIGGTLTKF